MGNFYMAGHALIKRKDMYLVLQRSSINDYMPLKWDIPGGVVEMGETIEYAIYREVLEETSLNIEITKLIYIYTNTDQVPKRQTFQAVYECRYIKGEVIINPREHNTYKWCKWQDITKLDTISFLKVLIERY